MPARLSVNHRQLDAASQALIANTDHTGQGCKLVHRVFKRQCEQPGAGNQIVLLQHIKQKQLSGTRQDMTRTGAAEHQLGEVWRTLHAGVANIAEHDHTAQR